MTTDRYFDVFVEYAKASPDDILMRITVHNRGPEPAKLALLPQLCFRNTWSWNSNGRTHKLSADQAGIKIQHEQLGNFLLACDGNPTLLFTENETNARRLCGQADANGFFKDAFHEYVVAGNKSAVNPAQTGTKAGALYELTVPAGQSATVRLRLAKSDAPPAGKPWDDFDAIFSQRRSEADEFYAELQKDISGCRRANWSSARRLPA